MVGVAKHLVERTLVQERPPVFRMALEAYALGRIRLYPNLDQAVRDILAKRPTPVLDFNLRTGEYTRTAHYVGLEGGAAVPEKA